MEPTARRSRDPRDKRRVAGFGCTTPHANCVRQSVTQDDGLLIRAADKAPRPSCHFHPSCAAAGSGPWRGQRGRPGYAGHSPAHPPDFHFTAVPGNREALPAGGGSHAPSPTRTNRAPRGRSRQAVAPPRRSFPASAALGRTSPGAALSPGAVRLLSPCPCPEVGSSPGGDALRGWGAEERDAAALSALA